jgi:hypothetical protein
VRPGDVFAGYGAGCTGTHAWIVHPGANRWLTRGLQPGYSLAYNGKLVTTASASTIQLASVP